MNVDGEATAAVVAAVLVNSFSLHPEIQGEDELLKVQISLKKDPFFRTHSHSLSSGTKQASR